MTKEVYTTIKAGTATRGSWSIVNNQKFTKVWH